MTTAFPDYSEQQIAAIKSNRALFVFLQSHGLPIAVPTTESWTDPDEEGRSVLQTFYEDTVGIPIGSGRSSGHLAIDPDDLCIRFYKFTDVKSAGTAVTEGAVRHGL